MGRTGGLGICGGRGSVYDRLCVDVGASYLMKGIGYAEDDYYYRAG